ncbi:POT family proton-dependent oligopeptide transporter [Capronia coronata CBS 617.96]|uniref:POT family proton-dependent oligopeptide transporter n=1 Tax=Capronia coronata CBS 617.96 TaxID=1182541 RepID=W9XPL3_9EURO|nr:POT family proton-dependent oligopeptide transporter [Capronia coronata CBS 617.96]EXJ82163.1 POT family proton-dependent oligopeptide transporter [Capronia coronata CBS 617.96]
MPVDNPEIVQTAGLQDLHADDGRRVSVSTKVDEKTLQAFAQRPAEYNNIPTPEELHGPHALRRVAAPIPWSVYTVAFVELCERFSYYGTQVVYSNFVNHSLPPAHGGPPGSHHDTGAGGGTDQGISGALGQGPETANGINTFNTFWVYCVPLLGAYMADEHWGRYKTICVSIAIAILGHIILVISSIPPVITHQSACFAVFMIGVIVMGLGTGGFKPNISPLVVEQINITKAFVKTLPSGERVIVDPTITQSRIYHYFYLFINIGALVGQIGMSYSEKYVGFWLAYLLPTVAFMTTPFIMWWGRKRYQQKPPAGSVVTKSVRVLFYGMKGRWSLNPVTMYKRTHDGSLWEAVKPSNIQPSQRPPWMTFDDAWVDEVRRGFKACAVFCWYPLYWLAYGQLTNNFTAQAGTMTLHGVPNDVVNNLDPFALIIFIPICDAFLYPGLRRLGINFTAIKKITAGFWLASAAMIWAAVVQYYIYKESPCGYHANNCFNDDGTVNPAPINVWAQTGCYVLVALSEIFASITSLEYAYSKAPTNMRSLVQAIALFTNAISAAIAEALNRLSGDPLLIWNYGVFAVVAFVGGLLFFLQFLNLDKEEDELNLLPEGHVYATKDEEYSSIDETQRPTTIDEKA